MSTTQNSILNKRNLILTILIISSTLFTSNAFSDNNNGLSDSLKKSLSILQPNDYKALNESLKKYQPDQQKAIEKGVDTLFDPIFEKMFKKAFKPSDVFSVSESLVAASDGDWEAAYEKSSGLLESVAYFKNFNSYLKLVSGTKKMIKAQIKAWENGIYDTRAYYNAQAIIERELSNRRDPYIPSYLIKFDVKSDAAKQLLPLKKRMMKREEAMFNEWEEKDRAHVEAVDELVQGAWANRLVSILKKMPTTQQIFNHFLYDYTSGPGNRPEITETYRNHYLIPLSRKSARLYKKQWATMIKNGFIHEMKKVSGKVNLALKVRALLEKNSSGISFLLSGAVKNRDYSYVVTPKADNRPLKPVSGVMRSDAKGIAAGRYLVPNSRLKTAADWLFEVKVSGADGSSATGKWSIVTRGLSVEDPNKKYTEEYDKASKEAIAKMEKLVVKLGADYNLLESRIKPLQKNGKALVEENKRLSAQADSINGGGGTEEAFNAVIAKFDENKGKINEINAKLKPLYARRNEIRKLGSVFGNKRFKPDQLVVALKKIVAHPLTKRKDMKSEIRISLERVSKAVKAMKAAEKKN